MKLNASNELKSRLTHAAANGSVIAAYLPKGRYRINKLVAPHNQHVICLSAQFEIP